MVDKSDARSGVLRTHSRSAIDRSFIIAPVAADSQPDSTTLLDYLTVITCRPALKQ